MSEWPLGYKTARQVVALGRGAFFSPATADLPQERSPEIAKNDLVPQFGYVGERYVEKRVLLLGINPGNGHGHKENAGDAQMMPILKQFIQDPTPSNFLTAQRTYEAVCQNWPIWKRHCAEIIGAGRLQMSEIAYANCLPWRTQSEAGFGDDVAEKAAVLFAYPLIDELQPRVVIALGKKAAAILQKHGRVIPNLMVWNRAQAATAAVRADRQAIAQKIFDLLHQ